MQSIPRTQAGLTYGPTHALTGARVVQLTVANGAVIIETGQGVGSPLWTSGPSFRVPGVHTIPGPFDAIRVRAAVAPLAGKPWPQYALDGH